MQEVRKKEQGVDQYKMKKRTHHEMPEPSRSRPDVKKSTCLEKAKPEEDLTAIENEVPQIGWTRKALQGCRRSQRVKAVELRMRESIGNVIGNSRYMFSPKPYVQMQTSNNKKRLQRNSRRGFSGKLVDHLNHTQIRPENNSSVV